MAQVIEIIGGDARNRTGVHGFAIRPDMQGNQGGIVSNTPLTDTERNGKVSNDETPPPKEKAAPAGPRNGSKTHKKADGLRVEDYDVLDPIASQAPTVKISRTGAGWKVLECGGDQLGMFPTLAKARHVAMQSAPYRILVNNGDGRGAMV